MQLPSPRLGLAILPKGCRSISVLPAQHQPLLLRPVPRAAAPQAGWRMRWRWEQGAKDRARHRLGVATPPGKGCTPSGAFPPAPGRFPNNNEEMLSFAATLVDVSLKYPEEGGGRFRAAPQLRLSLNVTGAASRTRGRPGTAAAGTLGTSPCASLLPGSLLGAGPTSCGMGDVWPARSPLPLMSPPGHRNC